MRRVWTLAIAATLIVGGCSRRVTKVEVGSVDFEYAFFIFTDDAGDPTRVTEPFRVVDGQPIIADGSSVILGSEETGYVMVALDEAIIRSSVAAFDATRADELVGEVGVPPAAPTQPAADDTTAPTVRAAVPKTAFVVASELGGDVMSADQLQRLDVETVRALERVTLVIPVDPEYCRLENQGPLMPFGEKAFVLSQTSSSALGDQGAQGREIRFLDADHLLVVSAFGVFVLPRGEAVSSGAFLRELPGGLMHDHIEDIALGPIRSDGSRELLVVGGNDLYEGAPPGWPPTYGRVWHFRIEGNRVIFEPPVVEVGPRLMYAATIHPDGRAIIGGDDGVMLIRAAGETNFAEEVLEEYATRIVAAVSLPFEEQPFILATKGRFHMFEPSTGRWRFEDVLQDIVVAPERYVWRGIDAHIEGDDVVMFSSANRGGMAHRPSMNAPWERYILKKFPPRFRPCASSFDESGELFFNRAIMDVANEDGYLHLALQHCNTLVQQRTEDQCLSLLTIEGSAPAFDERGFVSVETRPGELVALTLDGRVYQTTW